ncbi:MAG: efflux RND transporter periplasmic adaptor subunit [Bryobacteraceae bacterium]
MSQVTAPASPAPSSERPETPSRSGHIARWQKRVLIWAIVCAGVGLIFFYGARSYRALMGSKEAVIPVAKVQRGDVSLAITARGELRGGNPENLTAPMTGGTEMHITVLRKTGEQVKAGDVVVQLDTTEQEFKLKEAQADVAEAAQHLIQAKAQRDAEKEEDRYALLKAKTDVKVAELDAQKNPLLAAIVAKQNNLALESARDHLAQVEQNLANRQATGEAGIAMQEAAGAKAEAQAATARQNIESMTLRAHRSGYVSVKQNSSGNFFFGGMTLPLYQVGDPVRPGMAIAEIPDLKDWELAANIGELDRGHLAVNDKVAITIVAVPGRQFHGHIKELGGTTGPFWDRHFECKMALDNPASELRPGMSAQLVVTTDEMRGVLSVPSQALFESDGRTFVYVRSGRSFAAKDVKLLRRNETRAVVSGVSEGQMVALANPVEMAKKKSSDASPLKAVAK